MVANLAGWHSTAIVLSSIASFAAIVYIGMSTHDLYNTMLREPLQGFIATGLSFLLAVLSASWFMAEPSGSSNFVLAMQLFHGFVILTALTFVYTAVKVKQFARTVTFG